MQFEFSDLHAVMPEIVLLSMTCLILVIDVFISDRYRLVTHTLTLATLVMTAAAVAYAGTPEATVVFSGAYVQDAMGDVLKIAMLVISIPVFIYAKDYLRQRKLLRGEFYVLALFAILGMMIMISANDFLVAYLGLELLALCLYALVAFDRDSKAGSEAAMKYFVLGAIASGMLLYGITMVYGATGELRFDLVAKALASGDDNAMVLMFGLVFIVIGIAFKFGAVPFHMWVPDIYDGAPTAVTAFLGSVPKIAAFALAMRILVSGLGELGMGWQGWEGMLILLAIASMALGNLFAIAQSNIKRMLAYSTISHVGFIFLGLLAGSDEGYTAAMFYAIVYAISAAGAFGILVMLSREGFEAENLEDLKGLNERSPWLAGMMMLLMFSMAGVPPTVGFFAKLFVLDAVVSVGMTWLAIVGVAFSVIGAFYYIRVVKMLYFDKPVSNEPIMASIDSRIAMSINGTAVLFLGLFPATLLTVCQVTTG
ncbi:MAG: NADH-quinone oxidoreductase subunit NuoN [bacterium]